MIVYMLGAQNDASTFKVNVRTGSTCCADGGTYGKACQLEEIGEHGESLPCSSQAAFNVLLGYPKIASIQEPNTHEHNMLQTQTKTISFGRVLTNNTSNKRTWAYSRVDAKPLTAHRQ